MPRFKLVPPEVKPAMDQLWDCARLACVVIMRSHNWYGLYREYRDEVFDDIVYETVRHFIEYKVKRHTYCRQTKEGKPLAFADNVLSSCFGVSSKVVDAFMKRLTRLNETADIEPLKSCLGSANRLPIYLSDDELDRKYHPRKGNRTSDRAREVREEYLEYTLEAEEMGLSNILEFGKWVCRCGYNKDEALMWALEPRSVRRSMLAERAKMMKKKELAEAETHLDESTRKYLTNRRDYNREYARKRREKERAEVDRQLREVLGAPPEGYQWFEMKSGKIGQRRIKK